MSIQFYCPIKDCRKPFWTNLDEMDQPDESFCPDHEDAYRDINDEDWEREKRSHFYPRLKCDDKGNSLRKDMKVYLNNNPEWMLYEVV